MQHPANSNYARGWLEKQYSTSIAARKGASGAHVGKSWSSYRPGADAKVEKKNHTIRLDNSDFWADG